MPGKCVYLCPGGISLPSEWSPGFCHCYLHLCSPCSPKLCLKSALLQCSPINSSCSWCEYWERTAPCMPWKDNCCCDVPLSLLQAKNLSLFSHSLGSCYVDISLLLSFSFIFLYSQEMYSPFQVYSCNKRTPLAFFLCTLYLLTLIDFFIIIFFLSPPNQTVKPGQGRGRMNFYSVLSGLQIGSIHFSKQENKQNGNTPGSTQGKAMQQGNL